MKHLLNFALVFVLMLCTSMLNAQTKPPVAPDANPRVSSGTAYVKDTVSAKNKPVTVKDSTAIDSAAEDPNRPIQGGILCLGGTLGFPLGELATNMNEAIGYGFDISLLFNLAGKRSRAEWDRRWVNVYAGGNFQFLRLQGKKDNYTIEGNNSSTDVTSKVKNNISSLGVLGRVEFFPGKLKLFIEGGAGARVFKGKHEYKLVITPDVSNHPNDVRVEEETKTLKTSFLGSYSYGGGLRMCSDVVGIEFKVMYVNGAQAEYVDMESLKFNRANETVTYDTKKSATEMVTFQIGVSGRF